MAIATNSLPFEANVMGVVAKKSILFLRSLFLCLHFLLVPAAFQMHLYVRHAQGDCQHVEHVYKSCYEFYMHLTNN